MADFPGIKARVTVTSKILFSAILLVMMSLVLGAYSVYSSYISANAAEDTDIIFLPAVIETSEISINSLTGLSNVVSFMLNNSDSSYELAKSDLNYLKKNILNLENHIVKYGADKLPQINRYLVEYKKAAEDYTNFATESMNINRTLMNSRIEFNNHTKNITGLTDNIYNNTIDILLDNAGSIDTEKRRISINIADDLVKTVSNFRMLNDIFNEAIISKDPKPLENISKLTKDTDNLIKNIEKNLTRSEDKKLMAEITAKYSEMTKLTASTLNIFNNFKSIAEKRIAASVIMEDVNRKLVGAAANRISTESSLSKKMLDQSVFWSLVMVAVALILACIITRFLINSVSKPLRGFVRLVHGLTSGDGDLTKRIPLTNNDEFSDLAIEINIFIENVQNIVREVKISSEDVASGNSQLASTMEELSSTFDSQAHQISDIVSSMDNISGLSQSVVEKLNNSFKMLTDTNSLTHNGMAQLGDVRSSVIRINVQTDSLSETINKLAESSSQIGDILVTINDIADQTNLLALNAAIEAARAGDAGRGFAVVADEVRKLAERTQKATSEIEGIISTLQKESESASTEMKNASVTVTQGVESIENTLKGFNHVAEGVENANNDIGQVTDLVSSQNESVQSAGENTQMIASGIEESNVAVNEVTATVAHLQAQTEKLKMLVGKFTV